MSANQGILPSGNGQGAGPVTMPPRRPQQCWRRPLATVIIALVAASSWFWLLHSAEVIDSGPHLTVNEDFDGGTVTGRGQGNFVPCRYGWCLRPHTAGTFVYDIPAPTGAHVALALWFYTPPNSATWIETSSDGGRNYVTVRRNANLAGDVVQLPKPAGATGVRLKFSARNDGSRDALFLDKLATAAGEVEFNLALAVAALFLTACVLVPWCRRPAWILAAITVVCVGAVFRGQALLAQSSLPLAIDAVNYRLYALKMHLFTANGFYSGDWGQREPLFLLIVRGFFVLAGTEPFTLRVLSTLLSTIAVGATIWTARRFLNWPIALLVGAGMALSQPLWIEAALGLRLEAEILFLMGYLVLAFSSARTAGYTRALLLGTYTGVMSLLRTTYLPALTLLDALALGRNTLPVRRWVTLNIVAVCASIALIAPHRYSLYRHHGDPFYDTSLYARWNANMEFAGQPSYPSLAQLQRDAYVGPPISYAHYLFRLHTPRELLVGTIRGYIKLFRNMDVSVRGFEAANMILQVLALVGFTLAAFQSRFRWIPVSFLLLTFPAAYLYDRHLVERYRHTYAAFPIFLLAAGLALSTLVRAFRDYRCRGTLPSTVS